MKIFVSSLISGMEAERAAVKRALEVLGLDLLQLRACQLLVPT